MCVAVWDSPADVWLTVFRGFRREARLTPGYARTAFQAEEERPRNACVAANPDRLRDAFAGVAVCRATIGPLMPVANKV